MKAITIHGIDEHLAKLLKAKAKSEGLSMNKTIKKILETSLGIKPRPSKGQLDNFSEFARVWNEDDVKQFEENTSDMRRVNSEDWQ